MPDALASLPVWLSLHKDGVTLSVWVKPRAKKTCVTGVHGDALAVSLAAPPVDGAANDELIRFLSETLEIPRRQLTLLQGDTSRGKRVLVQGLPWNTVASLLS